MDEPPAAALTSPCCVCAEPGSKHCTNCKSRHYCSKKCQVIDWREGGHKEQCKKLATEFSDRLLDELMPAKKVKEEPAIDEQVAPAAGSRAAARLPAARTTTTAVVKASAPNDGAPSWRGTCAICLDLSLVDGDRQAFYACCGKTICIECSEKCWQHDERCPLCRSAPSKSNAEGLRLLQKHVDKGNAEAQIMVGDAYHYGLLGLKKSSNRSAKLYELAAGQGHALAQIKLGCCYERGDGVTLNLKTAAQWYRRAAEQGYPLAQINLGVFFYQGMGVAQSDGEAVRWYRLAAAQGQPNALYNLGVCHENGRGVPRDLYEALRFYRRAAAGGYAVAAAQVEKLVAHLTVHAGRGPG